jgi:hypothetical protein
MLLTLLNGMRGRGAEGRLDGGGLDESFSWCRCRGRRCSGRRAPVGPGSVRVDPRLPAERGEHRGLAPAVGLDVGDAEGVGG